MTFPMSSPFTSNTKLTKVQLDQLVAAINALPRGRIDHSNSPGGTVTLAALSTNYAGTASVTFTLTDTRRVKVSVQARFVPNTSAVGRYSVQAGYNTGSSVTIGSVTTLGVFESDYDASTVAGSGGSDSQNAMGHALLTPGTYTAYAVVQRLNAGDAGDTATGFAVLVEDIGAS